MGSKIVVYKRNSVGSMKDRESFLSKASSRKRSSDAHVHKQGRMGAGLLAATNLTIMSKGGHKSLGQTNVDDHYIIRSVVRVLT